MMGTIKFVTLGRLLIIVLGWKKTKYSIRFFILYKLGIISIKSTKNILDKNLQKYKYYTINEFLTIYNGILPIYLYRKT